MGNKREVSINAVVNYFKAELAVAQIHDFKRVVEDLSILNSLLYRMNRNAKIYFTDQLNGDIVDGIRLHRDNSMTPFNELVGQWEPFSHKGEEIDDLLGVLIKPEEHTVWLSELEQDLYEELSENTYGESSKKELLATLGLKFEDVAETIFGDSYYFSGHYAEIGPQADRFKMKHFRIRGNSTIYVSDEKYEIIRSGISQATSITLNEYRRKLYKFLNQINSNYIRFGKNILSVEEIVTNAHNELFEHGVTRSATVEEKIKTLRKAKIFRGTEELVYRFALNLYDQMERWNPDKEVNQKIITWYLDAHLQPLIADAA